MIMQDFKTSPFKRTAAVKAKALRAKRTAKVLAILTNAVGAAIGAWSVYIVVVVMFEGGL
tara:strand:+ start:535 stop:714 length:180 start_codon:yes stop_codon:yes gene_type:complete